MATAEVGRFHSRLASFDRAALLSYVAELSAALEHDALLSYAAALSEGANRHVADALLAKCSPLPERARDEVLLSTDLLPHVLAALDVKDGAAAAVCHAWKGAWVATSDCRRILRPTAQPQPDFQMFGNRVSSDLRAHTPCPHRARHAAL